MIRILLASPVLAILLLAACATRATKPQADACPVCGKPVTDGPEVRVLRSGESGPGTRYRCFVCPIMEGENGSSWTMHAVSGLDGKQVTFRVDRGRVESDPPTAVVLAIEVTPGAECLDVHRVFTDEDEFRRYVKAHPTVSDARPKRLADVLAEHAR